MRMTGMLRIAVAGGFALLLAGCGMGARNAAVAPMSAAGQIRAESLLEADRAFAAKARADGAAAAFADFMAEDGKLLGAAEDPVVGTEAIYAVMAALPENADMSWTPLEAVVADSGELGFTWGTYRLTAPGANGDMVEESGRYLTVWRKDAQGRWRGALDIGT
jgi:ketosteroid isomerase-like protein